MEGKGREISISALAAAIDDAIEEYKDVLAKDMREAVNIVAKECYDEIIANVTFSQPTGDYVRNMALKTVTDGDPRHYGKVWYVKAPFSGLTHLLENGHGMRNGKRTRAFPHIKFGEELVARRLPQLMEEAIARARR